MKYKLVVYTLHEGHRFIRDEVTPEIIRDYLNIEHGNTGDELLNVFTGIFNQQSRVKAITVTERNEELDILLVVTRQWDPLTFSKKQGRRKLKRLNELLVIKDKIYMPVKSKRDNTIVHNYDSLIGKLFVETGKPIHGLSVE